MAPIIFRHLTPEELDTLEHDLNDLIKILEDGFDAAVIGLRVLRRYEPNKAEVLREPLQHKLEQAIAKIYNVRKGY